MTTISKKIDLIPDYLFPFFVFLTFALSLLFLNTLGEYVKDITHNHVLVYTIPFLGVWEISSGVIAYYLGRKYYSTR